MRTAEEFDQAYTSAPDGYGGVTLTLRKPIRTTDSVKIRTRENMGPLLRDGGTVRLATARERGTRDNETNGQRSPIFWASLREILARLGIRTADAEQAVKELRIGDDCVRRTLDDVPLGEQQPGTKKVGNITYEEPEKRIDLGKTWTGIDGEPLPADAQQQVGDAIRPLRRPFRDEESLPELIADLEVALAKARSVNSYSSEDKRTSDARSTGSILYAAARKHSQNYDDMPEKRARLTADATPPAAKARMTAAEFAALRTAKAGTDRG